MRQNSVAGWCGIRTLILLLAVFFNGAAALADSGFGLDLDERTVPAEQVGRVRAFIAEVEKKLPDEVKNTIGRKIKVKFTDFGSSDPLQVHCSTSDEESPHGDAKTKFIAGRYQTRGFFRSEQIEINSGFIEEILKGADGSTTFGCGHGNFYRMATGALIHETLHAYDKTDPLTPEEQAVLEQCKLAETMNTDRQCAYLKQVTTKVSTRRNYLSLANWRSGLGGLVQKNHLSGRSPEGYELTDPEEHFALNGEYFLTDPEYACRRPAVQRFFAQQFKLDPFSGKRDCENRSQVRLETGKYATLDPKRIYQVQYLMAGPGEDFSSRWGHSMLRLIVCAPWREKAGPECLQDVEHHIVVSYRANVNDIKLDPIKGLNGEYDSRSFFFSMNSIKNEYGDRELRDLESYPLKLSESQKELLVDHLTESFWTYKGKYYFLTNNCATETMELIRSALDDSNSLQTEASLIKTPEGLLDALKRSSLIDAMPDSRKEQISAGYLFPSKRKLDLVNAFNRVKTLVPSKIATMEDYVFKTTPAERKAILTQLLDGGHLDKISTAAFLQLEIQCASQLDINTKKRVQQYVENNLGKTNEISAKLKEFVEVEDKMAPWNLLKKGSRYGVPIQGEIDPCRIAEVRGQFSEFVSSLDAIIQQTFPDIIEDRSGLEENFRLLDARRRALQGRTNENESARP